MAAATLTEKVRAAGSIQGSQLGRVLRAAGARSGGSACVPGQEGANNVGPGSAMSAWPGPRGLTWADREKPNRPLLSLSSAIQVPVGGAEEQQPPSGAEELAAQKREQRLRKFRELHLKRVSCPGGHLTHVTWPGPCTFVEGRGRRTCACDRSAELDESSVPVVLNLAAHWSHFWKRTCFLQTFFRVWGGVSH